jgi:hypothetical protein
MLKIVIKPFNVKVCHPRRADIKHNVVIRTVNKHNSMWYDNTDLLSNQLSLATIVIILTPTTYFGLQGQYQVVLGS